MLKRPAPLVKRLWGDAGEIFVEWAGLRGCCWKKVAYEERTPAVYADSSVWNRDG